MNSAATTLRVALGERSYDLEVGAGNLASLGEFISARRTVSRAAIIADGNVRDRYATAAAASLEAAGIRTAIFDVPPGEESKSLDEAARLWDAMIRWGADRKTIVVAVGGGVVGDLAGFVAACFARGLSFFQVPTTLLAQVDSSVGGKTGVNLPAAKNMVGAFWQPAGVLIDTATLATLPEREYASGLAEVVKYGVILDAPFFAWLEQQIEPIRQREAASLRHLISRCCRLKADVVEQDERELTGLRAVLNYGHTFAHALETVGGYGELLHGEAVSIGMLCASRLAERLGRVDAEFTARQARLLASLGLPIAVPPLDRAELMAAMQRDKKVEHGQLRFVLPTRMGHVELVGGIDPADALAAWNG